MKTLLLVLIPAVAFAQSEAPQNTTSGTNTGDVSLATYGSAPNASGASLVGQALTLQPASAAQPGGVTTGVQTFAGAKTFSSQTTLAGWVSANSCSMTGGATLTMAGLGTSTAGLIVGNNTGDMAWLVNQIGAATANSTTPAFRLQHSNGTLAATDLFLQLRDNVTTQIFAIDGSGAILGTSTKMVGSITLAAGTGTATVNSGAKCVCTDTTAVAAVQCTVAATTLTATGTGTDVINYICM